MKITLKQLDACYLELEALTKQDTPAGCMTIGYRLGQIKESADKHITEIRKRMNECAKANGFVITGQNQIRPLDETKKTVPISAIETFNQQIEKFLNDSIEEIGPAHYDKLPFEEISKWRTSAETFAKLGWLIAEPIGDGAQTESAQKAVA
jgi:hypothetical protein